MNLNIRQKAARVWASRIGKLVVVGGAALALTTGGAVAATTLPINSVGSAQIVDGGVWGGDVHGNTLDESKLGWGFRNKVTDGINTANDALAKADEALARPAGTKGDTGAPGAPGLPGKDGTNGTNGTDGKDGVKGDTGDKGAPGDPASDVKGGADTLFAKAGTTITNIGGTFSTRHTEVGTFTMKKGKWLTSLQAKFNRKTASPAGDPDVQPQLQLVCDGQYVTIMGNSISPALDADLTGSGVNIITVTDDTTCTVNAFGYNSVRGLQGSGEITVDAAVIATNA